MKQRTWQVLFWLAGCWLITFNSAAQIMPPDFLCVKNDSLFWGLPTNNCGPFESYDIYFSTNLDGPYSVLTNITDPTQTNFFHNNPLGETRYYFLQSSYDCPGEIKLSSDTLDNEAPGISPIQVVSVDGSSVMISWDGSTSPEVTDYIIFRTTPLGTVPIDTVSATSTAYEDITANPTNQVESYYILAMDACGNTSIFDVPHFTILLERQVNPCDRTIAFRWNRYQNWRNGIERQELWYSVNGEPTTLLTTLSPEDSTFLFSDTNDGDNYCFYVRAEESITGELSFSNEVCLTLDVVEPIRQFFLENISVTANNAVDLRWRWNNDAELSSISVQTSSDGNAYSDLDIFAPSVPLSSSNSRLLQNVNPNAGPVYLRLETRDGCDSTALSNTGVTIHLTGIPQDDLSNLLNWTPFRLDGATVLGYDLFRVVDDIVTPAGTTAEDQRNFRDLIDVNNPDEAEVCYYVIAEAELSLPDGSTQIIFSRSNVVCVEQFSTILAPNAFVPSGANKEFRPIIVFGEGIDDYRLQIFSRWGELIFESADPLVGWTGKEDLYEFPGGVYLYRIRVRQPDGSTEEKRGSVVLVR